MKKVLIVVFVLLLFAGCSKKPDNHGGNNTDVTAAVLTFPGQNQACTTAIIISAAESSITFRWNASANADNYEVEVKNLLTSDSTKQTTTALQLTLTLARNTPYSWFVVSKSSATNATAKSAIWRFYNPGPGIVTYAPYPAEIISPTAGQMISGPTVDLTWKGTTVNNTTTIANYDVYFGITSSPPVLKNAITDSFLNIVQVTSGTTYYWKIVTRDIDGNTSDSGLFQFSAN